MERLLFDVERARDNALVPFGPKLMNRYKPEKKGTNEHGKMLNNMIHKLEGRVPDRGS